MPRHAHAAGIVDPFLSKESFAVLATLGFGKKEPRYGPHKHHGIAARTRLAVAGKRAMTTVAQHRHQHHKERQTIQQVNDLAEIARDIATCTKNGQRVPSAVWEQYDRVNKRHKKHEEMIALAASMRKVEWRRARPKATTKNPEDVDIDPFSDDRSSDYGNERSQYLARTRSEAAGGAIGLACTFGSGREDRGADLGHLSLAHPSGVAPKKSSSSSSSQSAWGPYERQKLNELYWDLGRPPRRGTEAVREHFHRYTQRHCMVFPARSPAEVVKRLKLMFRYNAMKEPNEREHWLKLSASRGFIPTVNPGEDDLAPLGFPAGTPAAAVINPAPTGDCKEEAFIDDALLQQPEEAPTTEYEGPKSRSRAQPVGLSLPRQSAQKKSPEPLFRRSRGVPGGKGFAPRGGAERLLSPAAASYAADAIAAACKSNSNNTNKTNMVCSRAERGKILSSPFVDPTRPSSPAWGFGEAPGPSSRPGSRGDSRGGSSSRGAGGSRGGFGGPRGASRGANNGDDSRYQKNNNSSNDDDDEIGEETEVLDYTSLGRQTMSHRATSPAHAFSREGLASENLSMFQVDKKPEPGPGSFKPDLSATSTHPAPRCGVKMGAPGLRGGTGSSGGGAGAGAEVTGHGGGSGGVERPRPGPGQYESWNAIGRQILSTRPSSPAVVFASGAWELR